MINRGISFEGNSAARSQVAPRTPCMPCKARGHHCDAFEIVGGRAVCMHCLDGVDCPRTPRNGVVVDAPRRPSAVLAAARVLSVREVKAIRRLAKVGRSLENIANQYDLSLTRLAEILNESPEDEAMPSSPPTTVQAALAPGAEPSAAMPARRVFTEPTPVRKPAPYKGKVDARARAKAMLASGMSLKATMAATGLCKGTVSMVRKELPGLPRLKGGPPRKAERLSAEAAGQVVAEAEAITAQVAAEVAGRNAGAEMSEPMGSRMSTVAKTLPEITATEWVVVDAASVPDYRTRSVYDDAVGLLKGTPVGKALTRSFANAEIADTFMKGVSRRCRDAGVAAGSRQDGSTIYLWRKA